MAKKVMQFRYYSDESELNYPKGCNGESLNNGNIFNEYTPIIQLGIQTLPGTKFYLNNSKVDPIIVGSTGIYELDIDGMTEITKLQFNSRSLQTISNSSNASLIVDIVYNAREDK